MTADREILLLHQGELDDIRAIAESAGLHCAEDPRDPRAPERWDLVVAGLRCLDTLAELPASRSKRRIVVVDQDSRTLRARIRRAKAHWVVRRPVHPDALRLLFAHCLYRGPERRRLRVTMGTPIRFRSGLWRGKGLLLDLSAEGCRILTADELSAGQRLLVFLPQPGRPKRTFFVRARVVRAERTRVSGRRAIATRFYWMTPRVRSRIAKLVEQHRTGPAVLQDREGAGLRTPSAPLDVGALADAPTLPGVPAAEIHSPASRAAPVPPPAVEAREADSDSRAASEGEAVEEALEAMWEAPPELLEAEARPEIRESEAAQSDPRPQSEPESREPPAESTAQASPPPPEERRNEPRRKFDRHIVALSSEAARVLIGRDLSIGGMRVAPNETLRVGAEVRLALYAREGEVPLVVRARVVRNDPVHGAALRFGELGVAVQEQLRKVTHDLPVLETPFDGDLPTEGIVVSRLLDLEE